MTDIPVIRAGSFRGLPGVLFGMSTRHGGVSPPPFGMNMSSHVGDDDENVRRNRALFFGSLDIGLHELAIPGQVHSNVARVAPRPGSYPACDALITNARRVFLCVSVADCVPVVLVDPKSNAVAAIHAGWRGSAAGIVTATLRYMKDAFSSDPEDILAFIGPSAGSCCYNVGEEVAKQFSPEMTSRRDGSIFVDLKGANAAQLLGGGVPASSIEVSPLCTITEARLLHSFRRDRDQSGRMMAVIGLI